MPKDKDLKRLVRRRMAITGEPYTAARAALGAPQQEPDVEPLDRVSRWVELLAIVDHAHGAYGLLKALPPAQLRPAVLRGLTHESWRVRRSCAQLLDDVTLTDETTAALRRCLDDEHPKVRKAALHTLTCVHCKPDGCVVDVRTVYERMAHDPDRLVRKSVIGSLGWAHQDDEWAHELLLAAAATDPSAELRSLAASGIASIERKRSAIAMLDTLSPDLRSKVARHRGKWVAVAGGRVVAADRSHGSVRRAVRGKHVTDATLYCVP